MFPNFKRRFFLFVIFSCGVIRSHEIVAPYNDHDDRLQIITEQHPPSLLKINWMNVTAVSKTTATLQVVANPILNTKTSPVASKVFKLLHELQADLVRYVPWFPYPKVGVAELEPPNIEQQKSFWNFSNIEQQFYDTFEAVTTTTTSDLSKKQKKKRIVINFSTQPTWMFNTSDWTYKDNPNQADWSYTKGTWQPNTTKLVAEYYGRLASWIIDGKFEDEFGNEIGGGPAYGNDVTHWEVFNEPETEHSLTWSQYNIMFDAIVQEIRRSVDPDKRIRFVGMALSNHHAWDWWEGFLNLHNHHPAVQDAVTSGMASFHWYANPPTRTNISTFSETFNQIDIFLENVDRIVSIRDRLSPTTGLSVNELGVIPPEDNHIDAPPSPPLYYNMVAGIYTVTLCELTLRQVDVVGSSQLCGCPAIPLWDIPDRQYPGVSMTNWTTGEGNPRYWALKLILQYFAPGDRIVETSLTHDHIYVPGSDHTRGRKSCCTRQ